MGRDVKHNKEWLKAISDLENSVKRAMARQITGDIIEVAYSEEVKHGALQDGAADWVQIKVPSYSGKDDFILAFISHDFNDPPIEMGFDRWFFILEGVVENPVTGEKYEAGESVLVPAGESFTTHGVTDSMLVIRMIKTAI